MQPKQIWSLSICTALIFTQIALCSGQITLFLIFALWAPVVVYLFITKKITKRDAYLIPIGQSIMELGVILNGIVMAANGSKMPVTYFDTFGVHDAMHTALTAHTHYQFLADIIGLPGIVIFSPGDIMIMCLGYSVFASGFRTFFPVISYSKFGCSIPEMFPQMAFPLGTND